MSETKAAFAEGTLQSLESILYRYMRDYRCKYIHKPSHLFTTLKSRKDCSIDWITKIVKDFRHFVRSLEQTTREYKKPKFKLGDNFVFPGKT